MRKAISLGLLLGLVIFGLWQIKDKLRTALQKRQEYVVQFDQQLLRSNLYAPTELKVVELDSDRVKFEWQFDDHSLVAEADSPQEYANLSGFRIYRDGVWFMNVDLSSYAFEEKGLYPNEEYEYQVSALSFDNKIEGQLSEAMIVRTDKDDVKELEVSSPEIKRVLIEGDSVSASRPANPFNSWSDQVSNWLKQKDSQVVVRNFSQGGSFTSDVLARLEAEVDQFNPDTVVVAVGTNDVSAQINYLGNISLSSYKKQLGELVDKVKQDRLVILVGLHPIKTDEKRLAGFNKVIRDLSYQKQVIYVDVSQIDKKAMVDKLHPSQLGHDLIAEKVKQQIEKIVK